MPRLLSRRTLRVMVFGLGVHRRGLVAKCRQIGIHLNGLIAFQKGGGYSWECNHHTCAVVAARRLVFRGARDFRLHGFSITSMRYNQPLWETTIATLSHNLPWPGFISSGTSLFSSVKDREYSAPCSAPGDTFHFRYCKWTRKCKSRVVTPLFNRRTTRLCRVVQTATCHARSQTRDVQNVAYEGVLWTKIYLRTPFTTDHW